MQTPTISRRLAIINGFVEIPNSESDGKTALTPSMVLSLIPGAQLLNDAKGVANQNFIELPEVDSDGVPMYPEDWFKTLLDAVT